MTVYDQIINELKVIPENIPIINLYGKSQYSFILNNKCNKFSILEANLTYVIYKAKITYNYTPEYLRYIPIETQLDIEQTLQNYLASIPKQMEFDF